MYNLPSITNYLWVSYIYIYMIHFKCYEILPTLYCLGKSDKNLYIHTQCRCNIGVWHRSEAMDAKSWLFILSGGRSYVHIPKTIIRFFPWIFWYSVRKYTSFLKCFADKILFNHIQAQDTYSESIREALGRPLIPKLKSKQSRSRFLSLFFTLSTEVAPGAEVKAQEPSCIRPEILALLSLGNFHLDSGFLTRSKITS